MKRNQMVRQCLITNNVFQWQLADYLKMSEFTLTRILRKELPQEKQAELCSAIRTIAKEGESR